MKDLENLKRLTKIFALAGIIIFEKKFVEIMMPKNPELIRKMVIVGGTAMLVCMTSDIIFGHIDRRFNRIITQVEKDALRMTG